MDKLVKLGGLMLLMLATGFAGAQVSGSHRVNVQGNTDITASSRDMTAVAVGSGNVAKNRVGVINKDTKGNTRIIAATSNVTTVAIGRNRKACTNIGSIVDENCK